MPATVASRQAIGFAIVRSVAAIALFEPLVASVVIAERLPETGLVAFLHAKTAHPLGALPEVASRDHEPGRAAVLRRQWLAVVFPGNESLTVQHIAKWQVRRIAAVRERDHEGGLGV